MKNRTLLHAKYIPLINNTIKIKINKLIMKVIAIAKKQSIINKIHRELGIIMMAAAIKCDCDYK